MQQNYVNPLLNVRMLVPLGVSGRGGRDFDTARYSALKIADVSDFLVRDDDTEGPAAAWVLIGETLELRHRSGREWNCRIRAVNQGRIYAVENSQPLNGTWNHIGQGYSVRQIDSFLQGGHGIFVADAKTASRIEQDIESFSRSRLALAKP